jgi:uncharacterized protein (DUF885 family)
VSDLDDLAHDYLRGFAELDPVAAVSLGMANVPPGLTDYGPDGAASRAELARALRDALPLVAPNSDRDRVACESIRERVAVGLDWYATGEWMRDLRIMGGPHNEIRRLFELAPQETEADWEAMLDRLRLVPGAVASFRLALNEGVNRSATASRRQAVACAVQAATIADGWFRAHVADRLDLPARLVTPLATAAYDAEEAYGELADYLRCEYAEKATTTDGVGRERYELASRRWNGVELDLEDTYAWGWDELRRIEQEMLVVSDRIAPGCGIDGAIEVLETDPTRSILGFHAFIDWLQELLDTTVNELAGTHFDIPEPVKAVQAHVAPPGSAAAPYYTRPSADFSRPGMVWWSNPGRPRIPLWVEVTTAYHEGVPGHHLQLGYTSWLGDRLNPFQSHLGAVSGHIEGWALYAERLMGEHGRLEYPDYMLGMLAEQAHRAARVVVDIGLHLGLRLPRGKQHVGERWTAEMAVPFMVATGRRPRAFMESEVMRYLGWPAQAIGYKVGERIWLTTRDRVRQQEGASFDVKRFHHRALELGMVGLAQLEREMIKPWRALRPMHARGSADALDPELAPSTRPSTWTHPT